jgi:hypothetical protein
MHSELGELHIGPLKLDFPVVQAALSGYSDLPMRVIARRLRYILTDRPAKIASTHDEGSGIAADSGTAEGSAAPLPAPIPEDSAPKFARHAS